MKCKQCGKENEYDAKFCNECGMGIIESKSEEIEVMDKIKDIESVEKGIFKNKGNRKLLRRGIIAGLIILGIIGVGTLGTLVYLDLSNTPEKVCSEFSRNRDSAIVKYNKLSDDKKKQVDQYIRDMLNKAYDESTNNSEFQITIDTYKDVSDLKDYLQTMRDKSYSKDIYTKNEKIIKEKGGISNLSDSEINTISVYYPNITSDSEYYNSALNELKLIQTEKENRYKAKYGFSSKPANTEVKQEGVRIGMTEDEVLNSTWGKPKSINKITTKYGTNEQWVYGGNNYLYFENGILTSIQN